MIVARIPKILRLQTIYAILPFWIVGILCLVRPLQFYDLGHFIQSGNQILETGTVLSQDVFTHTYAGLQYVNSGWLSQVLMALCYKIGGLPLLVILKTFLLLLTMGIIYHLILGLTRDYRISLLFTLPVIALGFLNWNLRPQIFVIPIFAFFSSHLWRTQRIGIFSLTVLPVLMLIWVNLHSSFAMALILILLHLSADVGTTVWSNRSLSAIVKNRRIQALALLFALLVSVTFINPYGIEIWRDMWGNASASQARSSEWQATAMTDFQGYAFFASIAVTAGILSFSSRRVSFRDSLLLLAFLFLGFKAVRMVMWWGIVASPILAWHFCSIHVVMKRFSTAYHSDKTESESLLVNMFFAVFIVLTFIMALPWMRSYWPDTKHRPFIRPETNPVAIANFIRNRRLTGNMYNNLDWGSYLIWRLWPDYKVFGDNRLHLIPQEIWDDSQTVQHGYAEWERTLDKYAISFVALGRVDNARTIRYMTESPNWDLAYQDELGSVFVRKNKTAPVGAGTVPQ